MRSCEAGSCYTVIQAAPAPCDDSLPAPCDVTAGELRACRRATIADACNGRPTESVAACAPLIQRGCAEEEPPASVASCPDLAASLAGVEGIYEIVRHTANAAGCDAEGDSVIEADTQRFFLVVTMQFYGAPLGRLESCDDLEDCRKAASDLRLYNQRIEEPPRSSTPELDAQLSCDPTRAETLVASSTSIGFSSDSDVCDIERTTRTLTRAEDGTLRLESQKLAWQPVNDGSGCPLVTNESPAPDGTPCAFEAHEARLVLDTL